MNTMGCIHCGMSYGLKGICKADTGHEFCGINESEPKLVCPCGLTSIACRESACAENKQRFLIVVPSVSEGTKS